MTVKPYQENLFSIDKLVDLLYDMSIDFMYEDKEEVELQRTPEKPKMFKPKK